MKYALYIFPYEVWIKLKNYTSLRHRWHAHVLRIVYITFTPLLPPEQGVSHHICHQSHEKHLFRCTCIWILLCSFKYSNSSNVHTSLCSCDAKPLNCNDDGTYFCSLSGLITIGGPCHCYFSYPQHFLLWVEHPLGHTWLCPWLTLTWLCLYMLSCCKVSCLS